jgi:general stress protein 26
MGEDIKKDVEDYLSKHRWLRLGTVNSEGRPIVHTMGYVSEGATVYMATDMKTRKAQNIIKNKNVAYTVDEDYEGPMEIQGIQMEGTAILLSDEKEIEKVVDMITAKFPFFSEMPPDPDICFIKVEPTKGYFLDSKKGFGHRDSVTY